MKARWAIHRIDADAEDHGVELLKIRPAIPHTAGLRRAAGRVVFGIEIQDNVLPGEILQTDGLPPCRTHLPTRGLQKGVRGLRLSIQRSSWQWANIACLRHPTNCPGRHGTEDAWKVTKCFPSSGAGNACGKKRESGSFVSSHPNGLHQPSIHQSATPSGHQREPMLRFPCLDSETGRFERADASAPARRGRNRGKLLQGGPALEVRKPTKRSAASHCCTGHRVSGSAASANAAKASSLSSPGVCSWRN